MPAASYPAARRRRELRYPFAVRFQQRGKPVDLLCLQIRELSAPTLLPYFRFVGAHSAMRLRLRGRKGKRILRQTSSRQRRSTLRTCAVKARYLFSMRRDLRFVEHDDG